MISLFLPAFLAFLTLPAIPVNAQEANTSCFLGLDDAATPATLPSCESPDLLNTESNLDGTAILKRKGYQLSFSLPVATSPVTGSHSFIDGSGNRQDIVCQDRLCLHSVNGNSFATFLATAGAVGNFPTRWSFVDVGGILYGANDKRDPIIRYDGTTRTNPAGMPTGSILELTQDRLAVGDITSQPNRVHFSSAGAYEQFTVGVQPEDSFYDDHGASGDRIRGIKCIAGNCYIFKSASITLCEMADQYNTQCAVISPNIGTTDPASIVAAGTELYFRAQDKNYWVIGPRGFEQISKKIPNLVKSQSGGLGGGENSNTQTSKADWDAGTQSPTGTWDTTTTNGSIFPSSKSWNTSGVIAGSLWMVDGDTGATVSSAYVNTFDSGMSQGLAFTENQVSGNTGASNVFQQSGELRFGSQSGGASISAAVSSSSGAWSFVWMSSNALSGNNLSGDYFTFYFVSFSSSFSPTPPPQNYAVYTQCLTSGSGIPYSTVYFLKNGNVIGNSRDVSDFCDGKYHTFTVTRSTSGFSEYFYDGISAVTATDTTFSSSTYTSLFVHGKQMGGDTIGPSRIHVDSITAPSYYESQVSVSYDTSFSTPTWGPYAITLTTSTTFPATFYMQVSADNSSWDAKQQIASNGNKPVSASKRYWRHSVNFSPPSGVAPVGISTFPVVSSISLTVASIGTFTTQAIQPNTSISAWGTLSCAETKAGNGSLVYYATSAASIALLPAGDPTTWQTSVTNNATVTIATNTAVKIGWRSLLGSATDQAQVDSCVLSWNEGTPTQPAWAVYDSIKNAVYWTSTVNGAASANRLLKYDRNLEQWYPFDISAQAPSVINNSLYFGGAAAGTWNKYGGVDSDAGSPINSYWTSKDVGSDRPFQEKSFKTLSILSRNQGTGTMGATWTLSNSQTGNYTVALATGTGINYARSNYNLPLTSPQQFMKVKIGNNSSTPFEVLGIGLTWDVSPWRVSGP